MHMNNQHYLAITALGSDHIGILEAFTKVSKQSGCNILESKLTTMGGECALLFHLAGTWNTIAKLEAALPQLAQQYDFAIQIKRTSPRRHITALPYQVQVVGQDKPGILNELAFFFAEQRISIEQMECETYAAKNLTYMTSITLTINIPVKQHVATLRERFISYCEDRNLDAVIEPFKSL